MEGEKCNIDGFKWKKYKVSKRNWKRANRKFWLESEWASGGVGKGEKEKMTAKSNSKCVYGSESHVEKGKKSANNVNVSSKNIFRVHRTRWTCKQNYFLVNLIRFEFNFAIQINEVKFSLCRTSHTSGMIWLTVCTFIDVYVLCEYGALSVCMYLARALIHLPEFTVTKEMIACRRLWVDILLANLSKSRKFLMALNSQDACIIKLDSYVTLYFKYCIFSTYNMYQSCERTHNFRMFVRSLENFILFVRFLF